MIEHKILTNQSFFDCFGKNGAYILQEVLKLYNIDLTEDYLFEYTRDHNCDNSNIKIDSSVYINKGTNLLKLTFTLVFNDNLKLTLLDNKYSMLIIPKSDIIKIEISEDKKINKMVPCNLDAIIEFNTNDSFKFDLKDCDYEDSERIIRFIINLTKI